MVAASEAAAEVQIDTATANGSPAVAAMTATPAEASSGLPGVPSRASISPQSYSIVPPKLVSAATPLLHNAHVLWVKLRSSRLGERLRPAFAQLTERIAKSRVRERVAPAAAWLGQRWSALPIAETVRAGEARISGTLSAWASAAVARYPALGGKRLWLTAGAGVAMICVGFGLGVLWSAQREVLPAAETATPIKATPPAAPLAAPPAPATPTAQPLAANLTNTAAAPAAGAAEAPTTAAISVESLPTVDDSEPETRSVSGVGRRGPFNTSKAQRSMNGAAAAANRCVPEGARVPGRVTVTFAPTGKVAKVELGNRTLNAQVDRCVIASFKRAAVPAFTGGSVTVSKSFFLKR